MKKLDDAIISYVKNIAKAHKFDNLTATIMGILFAEPTELTMEELAKRTGYSIASVCNKVRLLEQLNIVTRTTKPGTKTIFVTIEKDMVKIMKQAIIEMQNVDIAMTKNILPQIIQQFKHNAETDKEKTQLKSLENIYKDVIKFEDLLKKFIKEF